MIVLGIETSCDETAVAVVKNGQEILSNAVASSVALHQKTGGIIPEQAARQQIKSIIPVLEEAIKQSRLKVEEIDILAVTFGPGLVGSLLVGVEMAKTLSYLWQKPVVAVNHLVGHLYANWLSTGKGFKTPQFPALGLVVSGGHTDLVLIKDHGQVKRVGGTRDDAAGECFDKTARLLNLGYPGGPAIALAAQKYQNQKPSSQLKLFPRPMINEDNFDFSFSGLKTAVHNYLQEQKQDLKAKIDQKKQQELAAETQAAIVAVLISKSVKAIKKYQPLSFLLAGGVAANQELKENLGQAIKKQKLKTSFHVPPPQLCTDNAAYIASAAFYNYRPADWQKIIVNPGLTITD